MPKIKQEQKRVIVYTHKYKIRGKMFMPPGSRLSDFIGAIRHKKFVPVTDAIVTDISGNEICKADFLELNKDEIVFLVPESEFIKSKAR